MWQHSRLRWAMLHTINTISYTIAIQLEGVRRTHGPCPSPLGVHVRISLWREKHGRANNSIRSCTFIIAGGHALGPAEAGAGKISREEGESPTPKCKAFCMPINAYICPISYSTLAHPGVREQGADQAPSLRNPSGRHPQTVGGKREGEVWR